VWGNLASQRRGLWREIATIKVERVEGRMALLKGWPEWRGVLAKLRSTSEVSGIEKNFDLTIYLLKIFVPSE